MHLGSDWPASSRIKLSLRSHVFAPFAVVDIWLLVIGLRADIGASLCRQVEGDHVISISGMPVNNLRVSGIGRASQVATCKCVLPARSLPLTETCFDVVFVV